MILKEYNNQVKKINKSGEAKRSKDRFYSNDNKKRISKKTPMNKGQIKSPEKQNSLIVPSKKREMFTKGKTENFSEVYNNINSELARSTDELAP